MRHHVGLPANTVTEAGHPVGAGPGRGTSVIVSVFSDRTGVTLHSLGPAVSLPARSALAGPAQGTLGPQRAPTEAQRATVIHGGQRRVYGAS